MAFSRSVSERIGQNRYRPSFIRSSGQFSICLSIFQNFCPSSDFAHSFRQRLPGPPAVRERVLLFPRHLGEGAITSFRNEERIPTEATAASRSRDDSSGRLPASRND